MSLPNNDEIELDLSDSLSSVSHVDKIDEDAVVCLEISLAGIDVIKLFWNTRSGIIARLPCPIEHHCIISHNCIGNVAEQTVTLSIAQRAIKGEHYLIAKVSCVAWCGKILTFYQT